MTMGGLQGEAGGCDCGCGGERASTPDQHTCMISSPRACITTLRSYTPGARRELSSTDMCTWKI